MRAHPSVGAMTPTTVSLLTLVDAQKGTNNRGEDVAK